MFSLKSITKLTGGIKSVRSVLSKVPSLSGLTFPPQVQAGLAVAKVFGVNLPSTPSALAKSIFKKDIDSEISGISRKVDTTLSGIESKIDNIKIDKIDWLL